MTARSVYLDHNATSPLRGPAREAVTSVLADCGNASSVHGPGRKARGRIEAARESIAKMIDAPSSSVVFTSGGSEANALALRGAVLGALAAEDRITRLFVLAIEHESVRANAQALAEQTPGIRLSDIAVTKDGVIDLPAFRLQVMQGKGRTLVAVMAANNETGVVQPVEAIAKILRSESEDALFHVDATQRAGRMALSFAALDADTMALSSHKLGGPQGAGALLIRDGAPFAPLMVGAQESARRGGTENVAAIVGFGVAVEDANDDAERRRLRVLRDRFETGLKSLMPAAVIFGGNSERLPNTTNFAIPGLSAETALIALDMDGIALSSGAACSSGKVRASHVLAAMGVPDDLARCGLRVSLGWSNDEHDIDAALAALDRLLRRKEQLKAAAA